MRTITIQAKQREKKGKGAARATRREGLIPAVLYGEGKNISLTVDRREFLKALQEAGGENVLFDIVIPGQKPLKSVLREMQQDVVSRSVTHLDFQHVGMHKKIHVSVSIHLKGEPEGVRNFGGILEHAGREVEVLCLPNNIPSHIELDVSSLMVGDSLHVSDLPRGDFEILDDATKVIAHVAAPTVERKTVEEEAAEEEAAAEEAAAGEKKEAGEEREGEGD
jgi:large subunit ribosomal protein L25